MDISPILRMQIVNNTEMVLHAACNSHKKFTEMTVVFDYSNEKEVQKEIVNGLIYVLKNHSNQYKNIRCNVIRWISNDCIASEVIPLSLLQTGKPLEEYVQSVQKKDVALLIQKIKMFQARSSIVWIVTDAGLMLQNQELYLQSIQPFLKNKKIGRASCRERVSSTV